jgi:antitoxin component of MazEF toxin-antitoxin module
MSDETIVDRAVIRERRQVTLPRDICQELGLEIGDTVTLEVEDGSLRVTPSKKRALDALAEIQAAFQASGITEAELLAEGRRIRRELNKEQYGIDEA